MSLEFIFLNGKSSACICFSLGDNNKMILNEKEYTVTAFYDELGKIHLKTNFCPLVVEDETNMDEFKPNSNIIEIVLDLKVGVLEPSSRVTYMYNKENSYVECYSTPIIINELYSKVDTNISTGFNGLINTSLFVQYLYRYSSDITHTLTTFLEECSKYGVMKTTLPNSNPVTGLYKFKCIRLASNISEFGELLVRFYIETTYGISDFSIVKELALSTEDADIIFVITDSEIEEESIPSNKVVIPLQTGLFSALRSLFRKCDTLQTQITQKRIQERVIKVNVEQTTKEGCCGNKGTNGGCCGGNKEVDSFTENGCCGGKQKKEESVLIKDCEQNGCDEKNCCSKPKPVVNKDCCKGKSVTDCCKTSGNGSCTCTDCKNKC